MPLNPKQLKFVEGYLSGMAEADAYVAAGYAARGHAAAVNASRLLKNAEVAAMVEAARGKALTAADATAERVVRELTRLAFFDPRKLFRPDGTLRDPGEWDDDTAAAVSQLERDEVLSDDGPVTVTKKVKLWDKRGSLELLGKHLKLFTDKVEVSGPDGGPIEVREIVVSTREDVAAVTAAEPGPG